MYHISRNAGPARVTVVTVLYRTVPDLVVHVSGSFQDVGEGEAGGADASDNCPPHNVVRVVGQMVKIGLNMPIV
jgi:hypothetical protein